MEHVANIKRFGSVGSSNIEKKILLIRRRLKVVLEPEGAAQKKVKCEQQKKCTNSRRTAIIFKGILMGLIVKEHEKM